MAKTGEHGGFRKKNSVITHHLFSRPLDTRRLNVEIVVPGHVKQTLVLNFFVVVDIGVVEDALRVGKSPWTLGYAATIHSSQGLTISDTTLWIDDNCQI